MPVVELELAASRARRLVLRMLKSSPQGHVGGALSAIDIITALYLREMNIDPANPKSKERDRFILSAGHKAMAQYSVLSLAGFFANDVLDEWGKSGTSVPGHPDMSKLSGIEANTGALGHGLPIGVGMALGLRMAGLNSRVFVLLGDGELPEGSNWEGASMAAHHKLDQLIAIVDVNGMQISGQTADVLNMAPIGEKFDAFGWSTIEIDGHDMGAISDALQRAPLQAGKPTAIVARTIKGKGITQLEGRISSHYWKPSAAALDEAIAEIEEAIRNAERKMA